MLGFVSGFGSVSATLESGFLLSYCVIVYKIVRESPSVESIVDLGVVHEDYYLVIFLDAHAGDYSMASLGAHGDSVGNMNAEEDILQCLGDNSRHLDTLRRLGVAASEVVDRVGGFA